MSNKILDELKRKIEPICFSDDEFKAVQRYVKSDKYRQKLIDFIDTAKINGDTITSDELILLALKLSGEEKADGLHS